MLFIICLPVSHAWLTLEFIGNFYDLRGDAGRNGSADQDALDDAGKSESMSIAAAALFSGKSENTIRIWAERYWIGRKIGGEWHISRVALRIFLDGDMAALDVYHGGDRSNPLVRPYFERFGLRGLEVD
jgi:hypothetical protein